MNKAFSLLFVSLSLSLVACSSDGSSSGGSSSGGSSSGGTSSGSSSGGSSSGGSAQASGGKAAGAGGDAVGAGGDAAAAGMTGGPGAGGESAGGATGGGGMTGGPVGDAEPAEMAGMTEAHNQARGRVDPPASPAIAPLAWSSEVAASAQAWADMCNFEHSKGKYGENLYANAGSTSSPADVVASWESEKESYDYASDSCSKACGHYTQVVWAGSQRLGCGYKRCTTNSPFSGFPEWDLWVCQYDPPGNFTGNRPYCSASVTADCAQ